MTLVHLVGFIIKQFVTMHGHMNVKLTFCLQKIFSSLLLSTGDRFRSLVSPLGFVVDNLVFLPEFPLPFVPIFPAALHTHLQLYAAALSRSVKARNVGNLKKECSSVIRCH